MVLGTHNSWTFLRPKRWWMRLIAFTARCQRCNIQEQHAWGVRFFDLRVKFPNGKFTMAHGIIEYDYSRKDLYSDLQWMNDFARGWNKKIYVRVVHEIRHEKEIELQELMTFRAFCKDIEQRFPFVVFCNGMNLLPRKHDNLELYKDYVFQEKEPSCEELYASVTSPKLLDDWYPLIYAKRHNRENVAKGTNKEVLLIDFIDIK